MQKIANLFYQSTSSDGTKDHSGQPGLAKDGSTSAPFATEAGLSAAQKIFAQKSGKAKREEFTKTHVAARFENLRITGKETNERERSEPYR